MLQTEFQGYRSIGSEEKDCRLGLGTHVFYVNFDSYALLSFHLKFNFK